MKPYPFIQMIALIILTSCMSKYDYHLLVDSGKPTAFLEPGEEWVEKEGYLESVDGSFLRVTSADIWEMGHIFQ